MSAGNHRWWHGRRIQFAAAAFWESQHFFSVLTFIVSFIWRWCYNVLTIIRVRTWIWDWLDLHKLAFFLIGNNARPAVSLNSGGFRWLIKNAKDALHRRSTDSPPHCFQPSWFISSGNCQISFSLSNSVSEWVLQLHLHCKRILRPWSEGNHSK